MTARIWARWRVNTASSASEISPTVARARVASIASASRLPSPLRAAAVSAASAARQRSASRHAADPLEALDLRCAHRVVVDIEKLDRGRPRPSGIC